MPGLLIWWRYLPDGWRHANELLGEQEGLGKLWKGPTSQDVQYMYLSKSCTMTTHIQTSSGDLGALKGCRPRFRLKCVWMPPTWRHPRFTPLYGQNSIEPSLKSSTIAEPNSTKCTGSDQNMKRFDHGTAPAPQKSCSQITLSTARLLQNSSLSL